MQIAARKASVAGKTVALVPTMGALHAGHSSLVERAAKLADLVIVSIFVNPAQFGKGEDLRKYPRTEKADLKLLRQALGDRHTDAVVFLPRAEEIYPNDFQTWVTVEGLTDTLEGKRRPGHFRGVTTIVAKLFNIVRPHVALFGMKDYQQAVVLRRMTTDLGYPIKFVIAPTVRETDGLAMSSRNAYFNPKQREEAACLYYALKTAREMVKSGIVGSSRIEKEMRQVIRSNCPTAHINYIAFTEFDTLKPVRRVTRGTVCSLAVRVHGVQLIDNIRF